MSCEFLDRLPTFGFVWLVMYEKYEILGYDFAPLYVMPTKLVNTCNLKCFQYFYDF